MRIFWPYRYYALMGLVSALLIISVKLPTARLSAEGTIDTSSSWHVAASNRQATAQSLQVASDQLIEQTKALRAKDYLYDSERRTNFESAGDAEIRAGDLLVAAAASYGVAADNWAMAATEYSDSGKTELSGNATIRAEGAREAATVAQSGAVRCFALAEEAFSKANADRPAKQKIASERLAAQSTTGKSQE
jgi:hypothetical protein